MPQLKIPHSTTKTQHSHACLVASVVRVWFFATPRTAARQASASMGFSRQEYWSGLPCPPSGDLPHLAQPNKYFFQVPLFNYEHIRHCAQKREGGDTAKERPTQEDRVGSLASRSPWSPCRPPTSVVLQCTTEGLISVLSQMGWWQS